MLADIHVDWYSIDTQSTVDRQSTECRSSIDRVSTATSTDIAVDITYSKHDPCILVSVDLAEHTVALLNIEETSNQTELLQIKSFQL